MISVPSLIRDYLREDSHKKNIRIHFPNYERTDICNDQIVINTVQFTESLCSQNKLKFGLCEAPMFECEVVGVGNITGAIIEVSCEIYCPASVTGAVFRTDLQAYVYPIPYGTFTVTEAKRQSDMNHRKITAYGGQAAIEWKPYDLENKKRILANKSTEPVYTPNLGYFIAENGINILEDEVDKTEVSPHDLHITSTHPHTSKYAGYTFQTHMYGHYLGFNTYEGITDYDALYGADFDLIPGVNLDDVVARSIAFFEQIMGSDVYDIEGGTANSVKKAITYYWNGYINYHWELTYNYGKYTNGVFNHIFYPYVNNFYSTNNFAQFYVVERIVLYAKSPSDPDPITEEINLVQSTPKFYKYKYKVDASPWTTYRLNIPTILDEVDGNTGMFKPNFENIDIRGLCAGIAETLGTLVGMERESWKAKFIDIKQLFSLLPSATLYPGQQLYPGATTGGKLFPQYYQTCWYQDEYEKPFGAVTCKYKDTNNKECIFTLYLNGFDATNPDSYKTYELDNNVFINTYTWTEAQIQAICETIADNIAGVTYMPVEFTGMGYPYVESGDTFEILTPNNDSIVTIVLNRTLSGEQVLTDTYKSV